MDRGHAPPTTVTWPTHTVSFEDKFHYAVLSGKLGKIRDIFSRGISVDCYNEDGQTALLCAAFKGVSSVVALLLSLGAKPNARCHPGGYTPVHAACYAGCPQILKLILQAGGDLRLCDNQRKTPVCWCLLQPDPMKVDAIRNVIEGARICVMQTSGVEMLKEMQSLSLQNDKVSYKRVRNMLKKSSRNLHDMKFLEELATGIHYTGFGKVYFGSGQRCASIIGLPYISDVSELDEEENKDAPSWLCGKFTSFNPRQWTQRRTPVSTRELYKMAGPHCIPDILITELEVRSKLHHPNLLMLLGVCQTNKCDSVSLVFERIKIGSLYSVLHFESERQPLSSGFATDIIIQICEALEYVHSLDIVHCAVTSHSIMLVNTGQAKLSCFEYALPDNARSEEFMSWRNPILTSDAHLGVLRHWMAPEVLLKQQFSVRGDIYSLASVMWELCSGEVPWQAFSLQALRQLFAQTKEGLPINKNCTPDRWFHLLTLGLAVQKEDRDLKISDIRDTMMFYKKKISQDLDANNLMGGLHKALSASIASLLEIHKAENNNHNHRTLFRSSSTPQCNLEDLSNSNAFKLPKNAVKVLPTYRDPLPSQKMMMTTFGTSKQLNNLNVIPVTPMMGARAKRRNPGAAKPPLPRWKGQGMPSPAKVVNEALKENLPEVKEYLVTPFSPRKIDDCALPVKQFQRKCSVLESGWNRANQMETKNLREMKGTVSPFGIAYRNHEAGVSRPNLKKINNY